MAPLSSQGVPGAQTEPKGSCQAALHGQEGLRMIRDDEGSQLL